MNYYKILGIISPFVIWEVFSSLGNNIFVPSLDRIVFETLASFVWVDFWNNLGVTIFKTLVAFVIANLFGIIFGYLFSLNKNIVDTTGFSIDFLRSVPVTALFPLFMIIFGFNDFSKTILVGFGLFWIVVFNTISGMQTLSKVKVNIFKALGADSWGIFAHYVQYILMSNFVSAAKITLSMSLYITITFEMFIGSQYGIGKALTDAKNYYEIPVMYFWIIIAGLVGYGLNKCVSWVEKGLA